jgi:hypothetical protein
MLKQPSLKVLPFILTSMAENLKPGRKPQTRSSFTYSKITQKKKIGRVIQNRTILLCICDFTGILL